MWLKTGCGHGQPCVWDEEQWGPCHLAILLQFREGCMVLRESREVE